ncbi:hypothetical protein L618_004900000020 [Rhodococcus rhodochrous J45]|uniref:Uncharacterized protein n=1 Tax=Rhodococcus rhodochrous J45 TaxID=935266 RepID=A0A562DK92_RHORH|nr:hypothetical protein L618_004900000020 [Rhodococcus rhodochrous J45]
MYAFADEPRRGDNLLCAVTVAPAEPAACKGRRSR